MRKHSLPVSVCLSFLVAVAQAASQPQLSAPTGLAADTSQCGKVTLSWTPVTNAVGYHLVVMSGGVGSESDLKTTSISYTDMKVGTHSFKVKALGTNGKYRDSDFSSELTFTVKECAAACTLPPQVMMMASPCMIWPPNHKMVPVTLQGEIRQQPGCALSSVRFNLRDEYGANQTGLIPVPATGGPFKTTVNVEAWRNGNDMDGRLYEFSVEARNQAGPGRSLPGLVRVPHDQR